MPATTQQKAAALQAKIDIWRALLGARIEQPNLQHSALGQLHGSRSMFTDPVEAARKANEVYEALSGEQRDILERMPVMSYAAAVQDIDIARWELRENQMKGMR